MTAHEYQTLALVDLYDVARRNAALKGGNSPVLTYALMQCAVLHCPVAAVEDVLQAANSGTPNPFVPTLAAA